MRRYGETSTPHPALTGAPAAVNNGDMPGTADKHARVPYQQAARELLRQSVFGATHDLLTGQEWAAITMTDIARAAGMSRQTLYNEFKSRHGVAQAYILHLVDGYLDQVEKDIAAYPGDAGTALREAFGGFLESAASDPLVRSAIEGAAAPEVLRLVTSEAGPLLESATTRLSGIFVASWAAPAAEDATRLSRHLIRHALSYVSVPPGVREDPAEDMSRLLTPSLEAIIPEPRPAGLPDGAGAEAERV